LVKQYCNGPRTAFGQYWEPQQPFLPSPNLQVSATLDEAGNFVSLSYGPLSQTDGNNALFADYHIAGTSSLAYNKGSAGSSSLGFAPANDFDNQARPIAGAYDIGADEYNKSGLSVSPAVINFGAQLVGTTSIAQPITVINYSATAIANNAALTGGTQFKIASTTCGANIAGNGATCVINVVFAPTTGGINGKTDTLTMGGETVALSGLRTAVGVTVSPASIDFGGVPINTTSAPVTVTVTNNGATATTIILAASGSPYARPTNTCTGSILPGNSCSFTLTFSPGSSTADRPSGMPITDGFGNRQTVTLNGHGTLPQLYVNPATLAFGAVTVNTASAPQVVTVTNGSTTAWTLNTMNIAGNYQTPLAGTTCSPDLIMNGGDSCTIAMTFNPVGATTSQPGTLTIATSVGNKVVSLGGTRAAGTITATPNQVAFGTVLLNTPSTQSVTLTNMGTTDGTIALSGLPSTLQAAGCTSVLAPKASCTVTLTFRAVNTTAVSANLRVNTIPLVSITGTGSNGVVLSPNSVTFASQAVFNASAPQTLTLSNGTNTALQLGAATISGPNPDAFAQTGTCGNSLAAKSSCIIQVTFTPTATVAQSATLTIGGHTAALSGTGKFLVVSSSALNFTATVAGPNPTAQTVVVSNKGNTVATNIAVAASDPAFTATSNCINLASGASCTVSVTYNKSATASSKLATLAITYDQAPNTPESVNLTGVTQ
jgi:hypothetical protein